ncbi:MAG TPA: YihY/virulence factor BrkB family protein [Caulobacteraceae bacterium]|nr:YihY/virulence factor BrkB family protein [Caulobacteraceae bacterium]
MAGKGWKDVLWRTRRAFGEDQTPLVAAGVTFYTLLALFPALAALVSLYGLVANPGDIQRQLHAASPLVPDSALGFVGADLKRLAAAHRNGLSLTLGIGLVTSLWSASGSVKALMTGLNVAYEERERRGFFHKNLVALALTLGLIVFGLLAVAVMAAGPAALSLFGNGLAVAGEVVGYAVLLGLMTIGLAVLYRYGPSRRPGPIRWIGWGSAAAIAAWLMLSVLFSFYVREFAHYNRVYGSFGAVVAFMMWLYLSNLAVLLGAELDAELKRPPPASGADGRARSMGARGADGHGAM